MNIDLALDIIIVCMTILIVVLMPLFLYAVARMIIEGYRSIFHSWRAR